MKRIIIVALTLTILSINLLFAQRDTFESEFYLGAGAGASASRIDFVPGVPQTFKIGFQGGLSAKLITQKHLGLLVEANFSQRGWEEEFAADSDFSYSRTLNYVEMPFMTHVYFGNRTKFIFNIGPQISFLLNDKQNMSAALANDIKERQDADPEEPIGVQYKPFDELRRVDYGLIGGIGIEFQTGLGAFDLEGRYYFGLGDVFESRRSQNAYFGRSAHRIIEAKLTYYIKLR